MARFRNFMLLCLCALMAVPAMRADNLTIIAVNDTHSQIDPTSDNLGGVARRRAIYDQLRALFQHLPWRRGICTDGHFGL